MWETQSKLGYSINAMYLFWFEAPRKIWPALYITIEPLSEWSLLTKLSSVAYTADVINVFLRLFATFLTFSFFRRFYFEKRLLKIENITKNVESALLKP